MIRNFSFLFVLLVTLSIVNAIPHKLHKRVTTFGPCPQGGGLLTVTISPDPLVLGETATFFVQGPLSPPAQTGSQLNIAFYSHGVPFPISTPFVMDLCSVNGLTCPLSTFEASRLVTVPADLPMPYDAIAAVYSPDLKILGCALASFGV